MPNYTYHLARSVEAVSCAIGAGEFETDPSPNWLCAPCATTYPSTPSPNLCASCQSSWLTQLTTLPPSPTYKRRMRISLGVSALLVALSALLANTSRTLWHHGALLATLTDGLATALRSLNTGVEEDVGMRALCDYSVAVVFVLACIAHAAGGLGAGFVAAVRPRGRCGSGSGSGRRERRMSARVCAVLVVQVGAYGAAVYGGVTVLDVVFVVVPFVVGGGALACVALERGERKWDLEEQRVGLGGEKERGEKGDVKA